MILLLCPTIGVLDLCMVSVVFSICVLFSCVSHPSQFCQLEMYSNGDILRSEDLMNSAGNRLYQVFKRVGQLIGISRSSIPEEIFENRLILRTLLQACTVLPIFIFTFFPSKIPSSFIVLILQVVSPFLWFLTSLS